MEERHQQEQQILADINNFLKKKEIPKLITYLEDSSQIFEFCDEEFRKTIYDALLEPVGPGYAYAQRTFDLFAGWKDLSFLPADVDLKRLRVGVIFKSIAAMSKKILDQRRQVFLSTLSSFFDTNAPPSMKIEQVFNLEDPADAEVLELLKGYIATLPPHEQMKYFELTTEDFRDSLLSPGQKIANSLEQYIPEEQTETHFTILIAGKGGAGKSTLTNVILDMDPEDPEATKESGVANRGTSELVTVKKTFESSVRKLQVTIEIIDTPGFELEKELQSQTQNMIQLRVTQGIRRADKEHHPVNVILYCFNSGTPRVEPLEQEFIRGLSLLSPVILVYTKAPSETKVLDFNRYFDSLNVPIPFHDRIPVYARGEKHEHPYSAFNLPKLARSVASIYPQSMELLENIYKSVDSQCEEDLQQKWKSAAKPIYTAVLAAGGAAISPIPFSDLALLVMIQTGMMGGINMAYGIPIGSNVANTLLTAGSGALAGGVVRCGLEIARVIPGLNIVSTVVSSGINSSATLSMGLLFRKAVDKFVRENPNFLSYDTGKVEELITQKIYQLKMEEGKRDESASLDEALWKEIEDEVSKETKKN
eukprot:TRINITY_DN4194_c0_g1_i1.p1 TRINITY_DN4194_c0_g1~~TRINITY_DN4194_c0_g1_i1.p1  ORF type:complete len:592 (-),score=150.89 TRINITY_DN4194_c0_g1_i1:165-1940(-)